MSANDQNERSRVVTDIEDSSSDTHQDTRDNKWGSDSIMIKPEDYQEPQEPQEDPNHVEDKETQTAVNAATEDGLATQEYTDSFKDSSEKEEEFMYVISCDSAITTCVPNLQRALEIIDEYISEYNQLYNDTYNVSNDFDNVEDKYIVKVYGRHRNFLISYDKLLGECVCQKVPYRD